METESKPSVWIEPWPDGSAFTVYATDQRSAAQQRLTAQQADKAHAILNEVDEHQCGAGADCAHINPAPVGFYLAGEYDTAHTAGYFLTPGGVALCEDCGIEAIEGGADGSARCLECGVDISDLTAQCDDIEWCETCAAYPCPLCGDVACGGRAVCC